MGGGPRGREALEAARPCRRRLWLGRGVRCNGSKGRRDACSPRPGPTVARSQQADETRTKPAFNHGTQSEGLAPHAPWTGQLRDEQQPPPPQPSQRLLRDAPRRGRLPENDVGGYGPGARRRTVTVLPRGARARQLEPRGGVRRLLQWLQGRMRRQTTEWLQLQAPGLGLSHPAAGPQPRTQLLRRARAAARAKLQRPARRRQRARVRGGLRSFAGHRAGRAGRRACKAGVECSDGPAATPRALPNVFKLRTNVFKLRTKVLGRELPAVWGVEQRRHTAARRRPRARRAHRAVSRARRRRTRGGPWSHCNHRRRRRQPRALARPGRSERPAHASNVQDAHEGQTFKAAHEGQTFKAAAYTLGAPPLRTARGAGGGRAWRGRRLPPPFPRRSAASAHKGSPP